MKHDNNKASTVIQYTVSEGMAYMYSIQFK